MWSACVCPMQPSPPQQQQQQQQQEEEEEPESEESDLGMEFVDIRVSGWTITMQGWDRSLRVPSMIETFCGAI